jgi:hypothetical protein
MAPPPPRGDVIGLEIVIRQSDRIACVPSLVGGGWASDTQERLFVSLMHWTCSAYLDLF